MLPLSLFLKKKNLYYLIFRWKDSDELARKLQIKCIFSGMLMNLIEFAKKVLFTKQTKTWENIISTFKQTATLMFNGN